jgi:prepilin-type N-terminal cleavage/methylation domain-containing protein
MKRIYRTPGTSGGFSLIEVMIAVVVLATGLLALAALQGSLTRSSAEAKTRSRVAAMLSARMDELRGTGYDNALLDPGTSTIASTANGCDGDATDWIDCARGQANLSSLSVTQTNTLWTSAVGAAAFSEVDDRADVGDGNPEFIRVGLNATWSDASGGNHTLGLTSEFSSLALADSILPPPAGSNTPNGAPIVRTDDPAGPGVIPIAVGGGDATAASNPRPELVGKNNNTTVTGTRFEVLTYSGYPGSVAVIQRRVETAVIKCQCSLGAGGNQLPEIYRKSEWPAIWTGERYDVYAPDPAANAPGQGKDSGPTPNADQSPLCQECCRDHFDDDRTTVAKFDPERTDGHQHYMVENGALTVPGDNDEEYVEACRVIRVDGFWRTAADNYSRQFGLLATETDTVSDKEAATGLPDTTATTNYQTFVKDYLKRINGTTTTQAPADAQSMFDESARHLNDPDDVDIATPSSTDYRYLHGRGLYLDFLETKAREKIAAVLADNGPNGKCPTGSDVAECILPYLPFTTINVTELSGWTATDTGILSVNSGGQLGTNPTQPSGGRTTGVAQGVTDNGASINMSNFGLAASSDPLFNPLDGVDVTDAAAVGTDKQTFDVGGLNGSGEEFTVRISGMTTQDPDVFYAVGSAGECLRPSPTADFRCATDTHPLGGGSIKLSNYWIEPPNTVRTHINKVCQSTKNDPDKAFTFSYSTPTFRDFTVTSATIAGVPATSIEDPAFNDKHRSETTTITFAPADLVANAVVLVTLTEQTLTDSEKYAAVATCEYDSKDNVTVTGWIYPWLP